MTITVTDFKIVWMMFKDWLGETFGRRPHFVLCPEPQTEYVM